MSQNIKGYPHKLWEFHYITNLKVQLHCETPGG